MHFLKSGFFKNGIHVIITLLHFFNVIFYIMNIEILCLILLPVEPHEAVAEVSKIGNVYERLVVVNHG